MLLSEKMDQSPKARILQARFDKLHASKLQQWCSRINNYLQLLKCCVVDPTDDQSVPEDFPYLASNLPSGDCIISQQEITIPDLVEVDTIYTTVDNEVEDAADANCTEAESSDGQIFNPLSLRELASDARIKNSGIKRRRRRHQFYQEAYCGRFCDHSHYHYVQTERLRDQLQAPFYTI